MTYELRHGQNGGLELGTFCKLPRTAWSAHLCLLPASSFRHLLSLQSLKRVTKRPVTDLTGKTQAVLSPSTVKRFLETNRLPHKEGHHATLTLTCPLCERETSQTVFINKTTGGLVCPPCKVHGELGRLGGPSGFMYLCVLWMYVSAMWSVLNYELCNNMICRSMTFGVSLKW